MSVVTRLLFAIQAIGSILLVGIIFGAVGAPIAELAGEGGASSGPFSGLVADVQTVLPLLLGAFALAVAVFVVVGGLTTERSSQEQRRPPR